jgi:transcriptional regulator with XRE-family HTH domain
MDPRRLGRALRAIRLAAGEAQAVVSARAGVSQSAYSRAERGLVSGLTVATLGRVASALDAELVVELRYRGGGIDRLIDRVHAALVEHVVKHLRSAGWEPVLEFSFNVFGERGSVDILAWHAATRTLLIVEVKSRFTDLQAMLLSLSRKLRLVPDEARRELGWDAIAISRIVVAPGSTENRNVLEQHQATFDTVLPTRAPAIRRWLRAPKGSIAGVWLVSRDVLADLRA